MAPRDATAPPAHLSVEAKRLWDGYVRGWEFDHAGLVVLLVALESFDRMRQAQRRIKAEGLTVKGRAHPAVPVERDARQAMLHAIRLLGLELEPVRDHPGRPPGRRV